MTRPAQVIRRRAPVERIRLDERSWVDVAREFAVDPDPVFEMLRHNMRWQQGQSIREGRMIPDPRLGAGLSASQSAQIPLLHFTRLHLEARYRIRLQGVALVLYRDGRDSVGFHRDDEMRYLDRTIVAGLCLGATRPFALRSVSGQRVHEVALGGGDLYVMGGRCQADWLHAVPKVEQCGPRISAMWRWTSREGPPCSSPSHFIPDAPRKRRPR